MKYAFNNMKVSLGRTFYIFTLQFQVCNHHKCFTVHRKVIPVALSACLNFEVLSDDLLPIIYLFTVMTHWRVNRGLSCEPNNKLNNL